MKIRKTHGRNLNFNFAILILIGILVFLLTSCENIFGPKVEEEEATAEEQARIFVYNESDGPLDIYMDGSLQFSIEDGDNDYIRKVALDEHELEAKRPNTSTVYDSVEIDVTNYTDYSWTIYDPPDINVANKYGKTLKIYMDGSYLFDIVDGEDRWIMDVSFGEHQLKALKASDNNEVASTTIDVKENKDYSWEIQ